MSTDYSRMSAAIDLLDGGTGEELFRLGVPDDRKTWSAYALTHPEYHDTVVTVHRSYLEAGSTFITTNNYSVIPGSNFNHEEIEKNVKIAGEIAMKTLHDDPRWKNRKIAGSLPPLTESYRYDLVLPISEGTPIYKMIGETLAPFVDIFLAETMSSIEEAQMAVNAVKHLAKPIFVSFTLQKDGLLRSGQSVLEAIQMLEEINTLHSPALVQAVLFNCCEPESITSALKTISSIQIPFRLGAYANALTPVPENWVMGGESQSFRTDLSPLEYLKHVKDWLALGVTLIGGCCAVGPAHIKAIREHIDSLEH